jgi:hypothetical protein
MTSTPAGVLHLRVLGIANPDVPGPALINNYRASLIASLAIVDRPVIGLARDAFVLSTVDGPMDGSDPSKRFVVAEAPEPAPGTYVLTLRQASSAGVVRGAYALLLDVRYGAEVGEELCARALVRLDV